MLGDKFTFCWGCGGVGSLGASGTLRLSYADG